MVNKLADHEEKRDKCQEKSVYFKWYDHYRCRIYDGKMIHSGSAWIAKDGQPYVCEYEP